jgi:hypothetical protein
MAENKTKPTGLSATGYLAGIADVARRRDCEALAALMTSASGHDARMWGPSIVGFGTHRYALAGGKMGETCAVGFASRKGDISIYGIAGPDADVELLTRLGKHERGKGCVYVRRLADVDAEVLGQLIADAARRKGA